MSVVAARVYTDRIVIAADSIIVSGRSKKPNNKFVKLNKINNMIVGGYGSAEEQSLMWRYMNTHQPESAAEKDILTFIIEFSKWKSDLIGNNQINNVYLIAYQGHLFQVENMFVSEIQEYTAIGAGEDYSKTALYLGHSPKEAVKTDCDLCCFVSEPIIEFSMIKDQFYKERDI